MKTKTFSINPFEMNCYIYYDESSSEGVIIDPGTYTEKEEKTISDFVKDNGIKIRLILNTHGHIDHIMGNVWAKNAFDVPLLMHQEDQPLIDMSLGQASLFGIEFPQPPIPDKYIVETERIKFANTVMKVIHTPGHSPGSVCFVDEKAKVIFGGDCIFKGSIGRTDLWMGDMDTLLCSIKTKILSYPDDYIIYPGHYEETTVGEEKENNPFLM
jgi:glyoxylase-like metal-dependent hydrolase (beta-lactamase superfamily II)